MRAFPKALSKFPQRVYFANFVTASASLSRWRPEVCKSFERSESIEQAQKSRSREEGLVGFPSRSLASFLAASGQKLGEFLLLDALHRCLRTSREVASVAVVVDAKDEAAQRFYEHFEFISLPDIPGRLFLPMRTIENLFSAN
jgi:hypothetical protein